MFHSAQTHLHQDKDIQRVVVLAEGSRDEAIVVRVDHTGVQHAIDIEQTCQSNAELNPGCSHVV